MRRKTIGFLFLTLIVAAGVVFVETRVRDADETRVWEDGGSTTYRVVLGGGEPPLSATSAGETGAVPNGRGEEPSGPAVAEDLQPLKVPPPVATTSPPRAFQHLVRRGDTLGQIVKDHLGSARSNLLQRVAEENGLTDLDNLVVGTLLTISVEQCEQYQPVGGECLADLARRFYGKRDRTSPLRKANAGLPDKDNAPLRDGLVVWVPR